MVRADARCLSPRIGPQPRLESAVIGFDGVVFVLLGDMPSRRRELVSVS
jgi:hypothetical protein